MYLNELNRVDGSLNNFVGTIFNFLENYYFANNITLDIQSRKEAIRDGEIDLAIVYAEAYDFIESYVCKACDNNLLRDKAIDLILEGFKAFANEFNSSPVLTEKNFKELKSGINKIFDNLKIESEQDKEQSRGR